MHRPEASPPPLLRRFLLIALVLATAATAFAQRTNVLLVLDASGSMFVTLDDGQYRITAAKAALTEFVSRLPGGPDLHVGYRVYGARIPAGDPGSCEDSVLAVPVDGFDRERLLRSVRETQAQGATPIAYSLALAADDLRGLQGRSIVVLVTDGAESCGGNVRASVELLLAAGVEVDLRIIGFALSDAAARSFDGLGTFENTASASELAAALGRAVGVDEVARYGVTVTLSRRGAPATEGATVTFVDAVGGDATAFSADGAGVFSAELPAGGYRAEVADAFAATPLVVGGLSITEDGNRTFAFELEPATEVALEVTPVDPVAGSTVEVRFDGAPTGSRNWLTVVPVDASDEVYLTYAYVEEASGTVTLRVPDAVATLEARYHLELPEGGTRVIGRSAPFTSRTVSTTVTAPAEVGAGARFNVDWSGPDNVGDYLTIVPAGAAEGSYRSFAYAERGTPAELQAPDEPGTYEVRYVTGQTDTTLARQEVVVTAVSAAVTAPAEVGAGARFAVDWVGPNNDGDYLTIVPAGAAEGSYRSYFYTFGGTPAELVADAEPGAYEVRYVTGGDGRTLASAPIVVVAATASLEAPAEVAPDARFAVSWSGPDNDGDYLTIVPAGAAEGSYLSYAYTRAGSPAELTAPAQAGRYEVRYVLGRGDRTVSSVPIEVR